HVQIDRAVAQHLSMLHYRLYAHSVLPDHEWAVCLRGRVVDDTVVVEEIAAALVAFYSAQGARFDCNRHSDVIGTWHNHIPQTYNTCALSAIDSASFARSPWRISLISCGMPPQFIFATKAP